MSNFKFQTEKRKQRVRSNIKRLNKTKRFRLSVFRSNKNMYAQIVDDSNGITIASYSTLLLAKKQNGPKSSTVEAAKLIGTEIANLAKEKNIKDVVFDKGSYQYHGRVEALANAARETGFLQF